jgi:putative transposase
MSQTVSPSTSRSYGLARVSRAWRVSRAGVYRFLKRTTKPAITRRRGPTGPCPDADLADHIRREIEASDFHGEGYRKIWARLRVAGVRSSPRRVRRVMGEDGWLAPHRVGRNQEKTHDGTIVTDKVNELWGTDMSQTVTLEEGRAYVFVAVEHANSEIVGIHAARSANRFEALEPVRQGVLRRGVARGLKLRHENRALHVVEEHAAFVRDLYRSYLEIGSVVRLNHFSTRRTRGCRCEPTGRARP